MGPTKPFGMLAASCPALSAVRAQTRRWSEERRRRPAGGRGARAAGWGDSRGSAEDRCQQLPLETPPQHTGPRADSDLPQNRPNGMSLTSWPGHSVTLRPPRRILWPVSSSVECQRWGAAARCGCALLPRCPLPPRAPVCPHAQAEQQLAGEGKGRGQQGQMGG